MDIASAGFADAVYALVARIPAGCVATYGQLAVLAGRPRAARMVGRIMARAPEGLPCHRVIRSSGELPPEAIFGYGEQRQSLMGEGVCFLPGGRVDVKRCAWRAESYERVP